MADCAICGEDATFQDNGVDVCGRHTHPRYLGYPVPAEPDSVPVAFESEEESESGDEETETQPEPAPAAPRPSRRRA